MGKLLGKRTQPYDALSPSNLPKRQKTVEDLIHSQTGQENLVSLIHNFDKP